MDSNVPPRCWWYETADAEWNSGRGCWSGWVILDDDFQDFVAGTSIVINGGYADVDRTMKQEYADADEGGERDVMHWHRPDNN